MFHKKNLNIHKKIDVKRYEKNTLLKETLKLNIYTIVRNEISELSYVNLKFADVLVSNYKT